MSDTKRLVCGQSWSQPQVKLRMIQPFRLGRSAILVPTKGLNPTENQASSVSMVRGSPRRDSIGTRYAI